MLAVSPYHFFLNFIVSRVRVMSCTRVTVSVSVLHRVMYPLFVHTHSKGWAELLLIVCLANTSTSDLRFDFSNWIFLWWMIVLDLGCAMSFLTMFRDNTRDITLAHVMCGHRTIGSRANPLGIGVSLRSVLGQSICASVLACIRLIRARSSSLLHAQRTFWLHIYWMSPT